MAYIPQMKLLVNLALLDGEVAEKERQYIINIGLANHMMVAEILPLFSAHHPLVVPDSLTEEQKFNFIFPLVQLMRIDEKIYRNEIKYCAQLATRLGYREEVLFELMLNAKKASLGKDEMDSLKKLTATYLHRD